VELPKEQGAALSLTQRAQSEQRPSEKQCQRILNVAQDISQSD